MAIPGESPEAIAAGLQSTCSVTLVPVSQLERKSLGHG
jgi:hypothetical protein